MSTRPEERLQPSVYCGRLLVAAICLAAVSASGCGPVAHLQNADGVRLYQQGYYDAAQQRFQQAMYNAPQDADAFYNLAATFHRLGNMNQQESYLDQAEQYYHQCLDRDPNHNDCHRGLAVLLVENSRSEEAFALLESWADRNPALPDPHIELARLFEEFGDRTAAKEHLVAALTVDPDNSRALAALGSIREQLGETVQALADYQRSLAANGMQEDLRARVAALQTAVAPYPMAGPNGTRTVITTGPPLR